MPMAAVRITKPTIPVSATNSKPRPIASVDLKDTESIRAGITILSARLMRVEERNDSRLIRLECLIRSEIAFLELLLKKPGILAFGGKRTKSSEPLVEKPNQ